MSSKDNNEECVMHSKSENVKIMINDKVDKVIEERFQSLQIGLETWRKGSDLVIDCVRLLYCNCREINFKRVESYIDSSWMDKKQKNNNKIASMKKIISVFNTL